MVAILPDKYLKLVLREFEDLPLRQGKISLTFEISCGTGGTINALKVKKFHEYEER
ncbi:hypothetical protein [Nitrospira sp. BLG_1]|uniref:hypothetical protein n=1 Tax=Nitrospira sp. BLG_1 TaxID=3395883 RepID=UPI0039BC4658